MPSVVMKGFDEYRKKIMALSDAKTVKAACKYALYPAAGLLADELKKATPIGHDPKTGMPTGDLADSITIIPFQYDGDGDVYTKVTFTGYDRKGTPNLIKARVLEHGRSGTDSGKNRFINKTVNRTRNRVIGLIQTGFDKYIYEKFRK